MKDFSGINFNRLHFIYFKLSEFTSAKIWCSQKEKQQELWLNKNHRYKSQFTEYIQQQVLRQIQQQIYKFLLFPFLFA